MAVARTTSSNLSNLMYLRQQQPMLGEPEFVDETVDPGQESALRVQNFMLDPKLGRPCLARGHGSSIRLLHQPSTPPRPTRRKSMRLAAATAAAVAAQQLPCANRGGHPLVPEQCEWNPWLCPQTTAAAAPTTAAPTAAAATATPPSTPRAERRGSGKWTGATFAPPSIKLAWAAEKKARRTARYVVTRPDHADIIESTLKRLEEDLRRS